MAGRMYAVLTTDKDWLGFTEEQREDHLLICRPHNPSTFDICSDICSAPDDAGKEILKVKPASTDVKIPAEEHEAGHNEDVLQPGTTSCTSSADGNQIQSSPS